jgi:gliding motility-associated-like protein
VKLSASGGETYVWSPSATLNNPNINNPTAAPAITTTYTVIASDARKCFSDTGYVLVKVFPVPQFDIVQSSIQANVGTMVQLVTTNSSDIIKWNWAPTKWLSCTTCPQPIATVTDNIKYVAEATNAGGCKSRDEVTITTLCNDANIFIPNTFSPNGDGMNDVFYARGRGLFSLKEVRIFDRWGEQVFERHNIAPNDVTQGWDGTYKGMKASADVYVYVMDIVCSNNTIISVKGNVTLLR